MNDLPTAQETYKVSWALFMFLVVRRCIRRLRLVFLSRPRRPPQRAPPPFWSCGVVVRLHLCPCHRLPRRRSSSPGPLVPIVVVVVVVVVIVVVICRLSPRYRCRCRPVPLFLSSWLPFFFVVAPAPFLPCQLLVSTPRAAARSGGMGVGVPSWRRLVVNNIDKT
jgi:hypothetical protein